MTFTRPFHFFVCILAVCALTSASADAQSRKKKEKAAAEQPAEPPVLQVPVGVRGKAIEVDKIVVRIPANKVIGDVRSGILCINRKDFQLAGGMFKLNDPVYTDRLRSELAAAGHTVVGDPNSVFRDRDEGRAELLIAAVITDIKADVCRTESAFSDQGGGTGEMLVEWQVFSNLDRKVVFSLQTRGKAEVKMRNGGQDQVLPEAFAATSRLLLADRTFYDLLTGAAESAAVAAAPPGAPAVPATMISRLPLSQRAFQEYATDIRGNVATVFAGSGMGSGFFVSDRHIITNAHVVGAAKFVKVKLITGREILGDVLVADAVRDVALIQTEAAGFPGLPVRTDEAAIGASVFAIGSPLDEKNEGTVSAGVISSYRTDENLRFIQSDVNVMPGNSGGPLLDDKGNVLGLTVSGRLDPRTGGGSGLNYFIPITDAMARLGLQFR
jgi:S1-C subfamily serine protease